MNEYTVKTYELTELIASFIETMISLSPSKKIKNMELIHTALERQVKNRLTEPKEFVETSKLLISVVDRKGLCDWIVRMMNYMVHDTKGMPVDYDKDELEVGYNIIGILYDNLSIGSVQFLSLDEMNNKKLGGAFFTATYFSEKMACRLWDNILSVNESGERVKLGRAEITRKAKSMNYCSNCGVKL